MKTPSALLTSLGPRRRGGLGSPLLACLVPIILLAANACTPEKSVPPPRISDQKGLPRGNLELTLGGRVLAELSIEIAETDVSRATGLMGVKQLGEEVGMVFLFDSPSTSPFYMKDTLVPLDIAFWDGSRRIFDILQMDPCPTEPCLLYHPSRTYIGAVEVKQGLLDSKGVRAGTTVTLKRSKPRPRTSP